MKPVGQHMKSLNKLYQNQSEEMKRPDNTWKKTMMMVWRGLQAMKLVHDDIGSTDFKYWENSLFDYPEEQLLTGLKAAESWTGFLTLGDFRKLCEKPVRMPYHNEFKALPIKRMEGAEIKSRLAKLREEQGL